MEANEVFLEKHKGYCHPPYFSPIYTIILNLILITSTHMGYLVLGHFVSFWGKENRTFHLNIEKLSSTSDEKNLSSGSKVIYKYKQ